MTWEGLTPPYATATIVADPPWSYDEGWPPFANFAGDERRRRGLPYSALAVDELQRLPVGALAAPDAHLFLWTTNRYLSAAYELLAAWGFKFSQVLTWCKQPGGIGPGGVFTNTTEFVLYGRRGSGGIQRRLNSTWWLWPRGPHSAKPAAFFDVVESVAPGPYVELFARQTRLGWDSWGYGYEATA